ncbi:monocarboxylate transporter 12-like [Haemaphysalis longicornis]
MAPSAGLRDVPALPYQDTARSWVVAIACAWSMFWTTIITGCGGIIFVAVVSEMAASREAASWPFNLMAVAINVSGVMAGLLLRKFSPRFVSMAGCLLTSLGVLLCAAFYDVTGITICYGLLGGLGIGLLFPSNAYALNTCFKKYRASASGMNWTGRSLATFVFPSVIICLNKKYGLRGTFIIVGGLTLNAAAGCLFLRSPEELVRKSEPRGSRTSVSQYTNGKVQRKRNVTSSNRTLPDACEEKLIKGDYSEPSTSVTDSSVETRELTEMPPRNTSLGVMSASSQAEEKYIGDKRREGCPSQHSMNTRNREGRKVNRANSASEKTPVSVVRREMGFLKRPILYVITLSTVVYACSSAFYSVTLPDHAMGQGLPKWQAALLVSCNGVGDLIAQLVSGQISDRKFLQRRDMMAISFLLMAASWVGLIHAKSMVLLAMVAVLYCIASGSIQMLTSVITVEYLGLWNLPLASSFHSLACALVAFPRPLLIGYYRDRGESYTGLYVLAGTSCFAMGLVWTVECLLKWWGSRRVREEPEQSYEVA